MAGSVRQVAMHQSILLIDSFFSRTGFGLARNSRIVAEMGHVPRPILSAINTGTEVDDARAGLFYIPTDVVTGQLTRTLEAFPAAAVQVGFIGTAETQTKIGEALRRFKDEHHTPIVVNPSLLNDNGNRQSSVEEINALKRDLLPLADIMTPSVAEAEALTGMTIRDLDKMQEAADMLLTLGPRAVLIRGGDFQEESLIDLLATDTAQMTFNAPRLVRAGNAGGSGGIVACAMAVGMAQNLDYESCVESALTQLKRASLAEI